MIRELGAALTGGTILPPAGAPHGAHLTALIARHGGNKAAAARDIGVAPTTLYRWASGRQTPTGKSAARIIRTTRISHASQHWGGEKKARKSLEGMTLIGEVVISETVEYRRLRVGPWIPAGIRGRIFTAWSKGQDRKAEILLNNAVRKYYCSYISSLEGIERIEL